MKIIEHIRTFIFETAIQLLICLTSGFYASSNYVTGTSPERTAMKFIDLLQYDN